MHTVCCSGRLGAVSAWRGGLPSACLPRGVCLGFRCLPNVWQGGVCLSSGRCLPLVGGESACDPGGDLPTPPCESQRGVKTLPCHSYMADGNKLNSITKVNSQPENSTVFLAGMQGVIHACATLGRLGHFRFIIQLR